jgi:hypothetical protein
MRGKIAILTLLTAAAGAAAVLNTTGSLAQPATPRHGGPVLVELYQSQGCSSCPPADVNVNALADRPDVVALSFGVTYWDNLGWRDIVHQLTKVGHWTGAGARYALPQAAPGLATAVFLQVGRGGPIIAAAKVG